MIPRADRSITDVIAAYRATKSAAKAGQMLGLSAKAVLYRLHAANEPVCQKSVPGPIPPAKAWALSRDLGPIAGHATIIENSAGRFVAFHIRAESVRKG